MINIAIHPSVIRYLPEKSQENLDRQNIYSLLEKSRDFLPFTKKQSNIFSEAKKSDLLTRNYLGIKGFVYLCIPTIVGIIPNLFLYNKKDDLSIAFLISTNMLCVILTTVMGMLFTGIFPDQSSNKKNAEQNELDNLKERFDNFALYFLEFFFKADAEEKIKITNLAKKINVDGYISILKNRTTQREKVDQIFALLKSVVNFILTGKSCDSFLDIFIKTHSNDNYKFLEKKAQ